MKWVFKEIRQNPFDVKDHDQKDPNALYGYLMSVKDSNFSTGSGMLYKEIEYLLRHFGVSTPADLEGIVFESDKESASSALDYLIIVEKNGGTYTPPTAEELYERTAEALSKLELPDFSLVDKETIFNAFMGVWDGFLAKPEWLIWLSNRIGFLSNNKVKLRKASSKEFSYRIKGPAEYLKLFDFRNKDRLKPLKLTIGPYSTPISFDDK